MTNDQRFYFKDIQSIIGKKFHYILVSSKLEMQSCEGKEVMAVKVQMAGFDESNKQVFLVSGCPCPPCKPATSVDFDRLF